MITINFSRFLPAALVGIVITVGFDAILHGLSHSGHGILYSFWKGESSQRSSNTNLFNKITYHIIADALLAVVLTLLITLTKLSGLQGWIIVGVLVGLLIGITWIHVYAAFETSGKIVVLLATLAMLQSILASIGIGWMYFK